MKQDAPFEVIDRDEAERRLQASLKLEPLGEEFVPLSAALGRHLAADCIAMVDVPAFDRANDQGFALRAADTYGAQEESPKCLKLLDGTNVAGSPPVPHVAKGEAVAVAAGGMLPRGADAVLMAEFGEVVEGELHVLKPITPGTGITLAGSDIAAQETLLRRGELLTSRETALLAAVGVGEVRVRRKPRVAIISTGNELLEPGQPMKPGCVFDSNSQVLSDAITELGGIPVRLGIAREDVDALKKLIREGLEAAEIVIISGGTTKGRGDLSYRAVESLTNPGVVAHGVALHPGKPVCLAVTDGKPVVVLPGLPTATIFTFHEYVAPLIRVYGQRAIEKHATVGARLAVKVLSEVGRTEHVLVGLVARGGGLVAYPMVSGAGSVTSFSRADGFITVETEQEVVEPGSRVKVELLGAGVVPADLVAIGGHCVGFDLLLGILQQRGFRTKNMAVGSTGGLLAAQRGECDVAGIHLLDSKTGQYNRPFVAGDLRLINGYERMQGIVFRTGDKRFEGRTAVEAIEAVKADADCIMINHHQGSGTRIVIDRLLGGAQPPGYTVQARSYNAVAASVAQGRADWGVAVEGVAQHNGLSFLPLSAERFDFVVPGDHWDRPAVAALRGLLSDEDVKLQLRQLGCVIASADRPAIAE